MGVNIRPGGEGDAQCLRALVLLQGTEFGS